MLSSPLREVALHCTSRCRQVREGVVLACRAALSSIPKHALLEEASPHVEEAWQLLVDSCRNS